MGSSLYLGIFVATILSAATANYDGCSCACAGPNSAWPPKGLPTQEDFMRANDECMLENGLDPQFKDLLSYENFEPGSVPDAILCSIKCANEKLGFLKKDGILDIKKMYAGPPLSEIDRWKKGPLTNCLLNIGKIRTCQDIIKKEECMQMFEAPKPYGVI